MTTPKDKSIYQIAWTMLNDEFNPDDDTYKGISKEIHNAALEAGWQLINEGELSELQRLRRWKAEATEVLRQWDAVSERFDLSGHLGKFTAEAVGAEIDQLRERAT